MTRAPDPTMPARSRRMALSGRSLRSHAARGTVINAAFMVGLAGLGLSRQFLVAIFLTAADYGLWGLIYAAVTAVVWLKEVGLGDKFVEQDDEDQVAAFHKAFTLNLLWTALFVVLILATLPLFGLLYGRSEIVVPGCVLALAVLGTAFHTPTWIFYRQMRFALQRSLQAVEPVVGLVVTLVLGFAGASYWSLVFGALAGMWAGALASVIACPYPIRLRYDGTALREYVSFSWPLVASAGSGAVVIQLAVILGEETAGLAGVGAIGLAGAIAAFADRVDRVVSSTLYPAICAVKDRTDLLYESFTKSNRLGLIWGMPFGLGLALFAPDLVAFVLGRKWEVATGLLQVFGVTAAVKQIGFNWDVFQRALGRTRPIGVYGLSVFVVFALVGVPAMLLWGLTGYAIGISAITFVQLLIRSHYLKRLFGGFGIARHSARAIAPCVPGVAVILALRLAEDGPRTAATAAAELALFALVTLAATWAAERALLRELAGYMRGAPRLAE